MSVGRSYRGANLDEALSTACTDLHSRMEELHYEVVEDAGGEGVVIGAEVDPVAVLGLFLSETFRAGELDITARLAVGAEALEGELEGSDLRFFTASGGRGLDALQYLSNRVLNRRMTERLPVHLDADGFKERRAHQLQERAEAAADEALRRGAPITLGPLTPAARREIHMALADDPEVETESEGDGFLKRVVVRPLRRR
ncbi:MAG: protein jag [Thermoanaerobaculales bacterium]